MGPSENESALLEPVVVDESSSSASPLGAYAASGLDTTASRPAAQPLPKPLPPPPTLPMMTWRAHGDAVQNEADIGTTTPYERRRTNQ